MRHDSRLSDQMRPVIIEPNYNIHAEGSCLISVGNTKVICTASVEERASILKGTGQGWVTPSMVCCHGLPVQELIERPLGDTNQDVHTKSNV